MVDFQLYIAIFVFQRVIECRWSPWSPNQWWVGGHVGWIWGESSGHVVWLCVIHESRLQMGFLWVLSHKPEPAVNQSPKNQGSPPRHGLLQQLRSQSDQRKVSSSQSGKRKQQQQQQQRNDGLPNMFANVIICTYRYLHAQRWSCRCGDKHPQTQSSSAIYFPRGATCSSPHSASSEDLWGPFCAWWWPPKTVVGIMTK